MTNLKGRSLWHIKKW